MIVLGISMNIEQLLFLIKVNVLKYNDEQTVQSLTNVALLIFVILNLNDTNNEMETSSRKNSIKINELNIT